MAGFVGLGGASNSSTPSGFVGLGETQGTPQKTFLQKITGFLGSVLPAAIKVGSAINNPVAAATSFAVSKPGIDLAKDVARSTPRAGAAIALDQFNNKQSFTPQTAPEKFLFGQDEVQSFTDKRASYTKIAQDLAAKVGLSNPKAKYAGETLGPLAAIAFTIGDLVPVAPESSEAKLLKNLAKLKDVEEIRPILSKLGLEGVVIEDAAKAISKLSRPKDVQKVLRAAEEVTHAAANAGAAVPEINYAAKGLRESTQTPIVEPLTSKTFYRGGGEGSMPIGTAQDIINYERNDLGNLGVVAEKGVDLGKIDAKDTQWLTETSAAAKEYGKTEKVLLQEGGYRIIARDGQGGVLVEKIKNITDAIPSPGGEEASAAKLFDAATTKVGEVPPGVSPLIPEVAKAGEELLSPIERVTKALQDSKVLNKEQAAIYSKERSIRVKEFTKQLADATTESEVKAAKSALAGEMNKVSMESLRKSVSPSDIDALFKQVAQHPTLAGFEKAKAITGLGKLFGAEGAAIPTNSELEALKHIFPPGAIKVLEQKQGIWQKIGTAFVKAIGVPRSIMSSFDLSAPFRQGIFMIGKPKVFFGAFPDMFRALKSPEGYAALNKAIEQMPHYKLMRESKLALTDIGTHINSREEAFVSDWAEHIPGEGVPGIKYASKGYNKTIGRMVGASQRAYTGFLNKIRADAFSDLITKAEIAGVDTHAGSSVAESAARFVNSATGRGKLPDMVEKASAFTSSIFFSPKLVASRLNLMNPVYYTKLDPLVRTEALKTLVVDATIAASVLGLAHAAGADISLNPTSSDFLKIRLPKPFSQTRYDILGGFGQYSVLFMREILGKTTSSVSGKTTEFGSGFGQQNRVQVLYNFFENKEAPVPAFLTKALKGKDPTGQPFSVGSSVAQMVTPLVFQDMRDLYQQYDAKGIPLIIPALFGIGHQTYIPVKNKAKTSGSHLGR